VMPALYRVGNLKDIAENSVEMHEIRAPAEVEAGDGVAAHFEVEEAGASSGHV